MWRFSTFVGLHGFDLTKVILPTTRLFINIYAYVFIYFCVQVDGRRRGGICKQWDENYALVLTEFMSLDPSGHANALAPLLAIDPWEGVVLRIRCCLH